MPLETAIHKMTRLPASHVGIPDRGLLMRGFWADLVVFNPKEIMDMTTPAEPARPPAGIRYVIVNGAVAVTDGQLTGARAGKVLRAPLGRVMEI